MKSVKLHSSDECKIRGKSLLTFYSLILFIFSRVFIRMHWLGLHPISQSIIAQCYFKSQVRSDSNVSVYSKQNVKLNSCKNYSYVQHIITYILFEKELHNSINKKLLSGVLVHLFIKIHSYKPCTTTHSLSHKDFKLT